MKLLFSSPDLGAVGSLVKRLISARIPCAVFKDPANYAHLRVWLQRDTDFAAALPLLIPQLGQRRMPDLGALGLPEGRGLRTEPHSL
jgi:hypothetical protein